MLIAKSIIVNVKIQYYYVRILNLIKKKKNKKKYFLSLISYLCIFMKRILCE